ncbi:MAG: signal peptidase I [Vicinamibacterales bacterium]
MASSPSVSGADGRHPQKSTIREYFESIVVAVILALFIRTWTVQAFKIPTGSMEQNLLIGDHLLVNKWKFAPALSTLERAVLPISSIERGDIVVFKYPEDPERDFIKRVIGLPGETLELKSKIVHINGTRLDERYVHFLLPVGHGAVGEETSSDVRDNFGPVTVPEGFVFVMGDNRDNSQDSRYWGFLPINYIKGKALMVYWSYDDRTTPADGALSRATGILAGTRWSRLFHQIR